MTWNIQWQGRAAQHCGRSNFNVKRHTRFFGGETSNLWFSTTTVRCSHCCYYMYTNIEECARFSSRGTRLIELKLNTTCRIVRLCDQSHSQNYSPLNEIMLKVLPDKWMNKQLSPACLQSLTMSPVQNALRSITSMGNLYVYFTSADSYVW